MSKRLNIVVLYGGKSGEHEVSLVSAASVLWHLDNEKYHIIPVGMDKTGQLHLHDYIDLLDYREALPVSTDKSRPLVGLLTNGQFSIEADVVFPVVHGPLYEDGCLQGILKLSGVAFVGCDVLASAVAMDKDMARRIACIHGLKTAQYRSLSWHTSPEERREFCHQVAKELKWPLFVKPCSLGSSVGIHKANNANELVSAVEDALRYDEEILVEQYIGGREIELAVLENRNPSAPPKVSIAGEIKVHHTDGFYSYKAKYIDSGQSELIIPAPLNTKVQQRLQEAAAAIFTRLKCKGMARVDFFVDNKTDDLYFNELNTLPGFTSISMYPKLWEATGLTYSELLDELIQLAQAHQHCRNHLVTNYL
jgi:D-alanine-D-alanine ligase